LQLQISLSLLAPSRWRGSVALYGHHLRVSFPTRMSTGIVPPAYVASVLLSEREVVDLPLSTPAPCAPLHFVTTTRPPSSSRVSTGSNGAGARGARSHSDAAVAPAGRQADCREGEEDVRAAGVKARRVELALVSWLYAAHMRSG
jgi:hypothetical protein